MTHDMLSANGYRCLL